MSGREELAALLASILDCHERQDAGCICGWAYDDDQLTYDAHLADALVDLLAARDRRVPGEAVARAEGDVRDYRAAYSRCVDLAEEWQRSNHRTWVSSMGDELQDALDGNR